MKKLMIIATVIAANIVLLCSTSCNGGKSSSDSPATNGTDGVAAITPAEGSIVFVRMDSLLNQYDMYHDLKSQMEEKVKKAQADLDLKGRAFERDASDFQDKVNKGLMTRSESQTKADELGKRQQQLLDLRQKTSASLEEEQVVMLNRISDAINTYIKKYNETKHYSLIINTTGNSTVMYGNPGLDITTDVVKGLNEEYTKAPKETPKETPNK